ncbi:Hpt domain-containing protein [bacterium]|nr:Hpt domain-containing protein [bacterium]
MFKPIPLEAEVMETVPLTTHLELKSFFDYFNSKSGFETQIFVNLYQDTSEETVIRILAHFNENLKEAVKNTKEAIAEENCEAVWKSTHKLAGSAELLGFKRFAKDARELSKQIRANPVIENYTYEISTYVTQAGELSQQIEIIFPSIKSFL